MSLYKKILTIGFVIVALASCGTKKEEEKIELRTVRHKTIELKSPAQSLSFTGDIKSTFEPEVSFRVPGNIEKMNFKLGQPVKKGEVLATLDKIDYEIQLRKAESSYETARASQIEAQSSYNRIKELYQNDSVSKSEFDSAKARMDSTAASLKVADEGVKYAKRQLKYTQLKSPIDGTVAVKVSEVNENVAAGQSVYILNTDADLQAITFVPESAIGQIKIGSQVNIYAGALEKTYLGKVVRVATSSLQYGATYPVKVAILDADKSLKSGMSVVVDFNKDEVSEKNKIFIPLNVILKGADTNYVFIVEKAGEGIGIVRKIEVKTGMVTNKGLEILDGLSEGDELITAGMTKLEDGQQVKLK
ncbi:MULTISPECIES: efflux RND transporter periplasmic adaptor subunit [Psychrilyobacter]|nr:MULTISPECIES: efflux RND transporter periplasmic adaptor subunit [Psychrilyobacter]MCS5421569.1 efflux RND transporter periplasmic adaptor subunit [Psychrilyobacter sp. S5]NDI78585.1 efflux RND transporter periplasmic adaptor subunit [Psychrilyobacter piezotolerans]